MCAKDEIKELIKLSKLTIERLDNLEERVNDIDDDMNSLFDDVYGCDDDEVIEFALNNNMSVNDFVTTCENLGYKKISITMNDDCCDMCIEE